ncbi:hypothetical protein ILUMI_10838, partial [Ignelater luminosus]
MFVASEEANKDWVVPRTIRSLSFLNTKAEEAVKEKKKPWKKYIQMEAQQDTFEVNENNEKIEKKKQIKMENNHVKEDKREPEVIRWMKEKGREWLWKICDKASKQQKMPKKWENILLLNNRDRNKTSRRKNRRIVIKENRRKTMELVQTYYENDPDRNARKVLETKRLKKRKQIGSRKAEIGKAMKKTQEEIKILKRDKKGGRSRPKKNQKDNEIKKKSLL